MDFRILGPLEALDDGRPLKLGGSKQRARLALLLMHANESLSTDKVIDELYHERAEELMSSAESTYHELGMRAASHRPLSSAS